jgi:hypothetical protein
VQEDAMLFFHDPDPLEVEPAAIPVADISEKGVVRCAKCRRREREEVYYDGAGKYYCDGCIDDVIDKAKVEAIAYAEEHCKITSRLPEYDSIHEFRCSPEDYEMGYRESYTPNAYMCHCRHQCTNYDELIDPLDTDTIEGEVYYKAIKARITELLEPEVEKRLYEDDEDDGTPAGTS